MGFAPSISANPAQNRFFFWPSSVSPIPTNSSPPEVLQNAETERDNLAGVMSLCLRSKYDPSSREKSRSTSDGSICFLSGTKFAHLETEIPFASYHWFDLNLYNQAHMVLHARRQKQTVGCDRMTRN